MIDRARICCALLFALVGSVEGAELEASPMVSGSTGSMASLSEAYAGCFLVGTAIPGTGLSDEERRLLFGQFNAVTPESCMKPVPLQAVENNFDFSEADVLVDMAAANGVPVNGHTLIWHDQCPDWFFVDGDKPAGRGLVLKRMRAHIAAVAGHFAGKVKSWDVVNEAIDDGSAYLRRTKWLTSIGEDYIAEAFKAARKADPDAELYYNDYGIEVQPKRGKALRLVRELKHRGVSIQGVGIQGHWELDKIPYDDIEQAIVAFAAEGLDVMITELDIDVVPREQGVIATLIGAKNKRDPFSAGLSADVQQRLSDQYAKLFALFRKHHDKISRVTFWGLHDGRSWLNYWPWERTNHPLLWDRELHPKPAYSAILAFARDNGQCALPAAAND